MAATRASNALHAKMVPSVAGYVLQPDSVGDTGPSDLAKAKRDAANPKDGQELIKDHFTVGYQELFQNSAQDQVIVFVYQFATPTDAKTYCTYDTAGFYTNPGGAPVTHVPVPAIPGAVAGRFADAKTTTEAAGFGVGDSCVKAISVGGVGAQAPASGLGLAVAQRQYDLLR